MRERGSGENENREEGEGKKEGRARGDEDIKEEKQRRPKRKEKRRNRGDKENREEKGVGKVKGRDVRMAQGRMERLGRAIESSRGKTGRKTDGHEENKR